MPQPMPTAYIALGANLGDREQQIRAAANRLRATDGIISIALSPVMEYPAVGGPENSPPFLNAAAEVRTTLSPRDLLDRLLEIERTMGRVRDEKWGPRTIDLDLLLYEDRVLHEPGLDLPHPRLHERRFVLEPLAQIAPQAVHPVLKRTIAELLAALWAIEIPIPPELRLPVPRAVPPKPIDTGRSSERKSMIVWNLILPVSFWVLYQILDPLVFFHLPTVPATFVSSWSGAGSHGHYYFVRYRYFVDGQKLVDSESVSESMYSAMGVGTSLRVRVLSIAGVRYDRLDRSWSEYAGEKAFQWKATALILGIIVLACWAAPRASAIERQRQTELIRTGTPTVATFLRVKTGSFRVGPDERCYFEFLLPDNRMKRIVAPCYQSLESGQRVVILYNPDWPEDCCVYENMGFRAGDALTDK